MRHYYLTSILLVVLWVGSVAQADVSVAGITEKRALLVIDGGHPQWLAIGESSPEGVKLIAINGNDATIIDASGKRETVSMGDNTSLGGESQGGNQSVTLIMNEKGQFFTNGSINGIGVRFIVDTGATFVSMNSQEAERLGIDYLSGQKGAIGTANGVVAAYKVKLDEVRVGDITLNNVDCVVPVGPGMSVVLLGMSFLNRMEMQRDGETMVLTKRY